MAYYWKADYTDHEPAHSELASIGLFDQFSEQSSAEAWLTASFDELTELGVASVSLFCDDECVYGPMLLTE